MKDATIKKEEPLYQQGRFPSVIDTDDMVFELGKQVVNHLNHEKLIGQIIKQTETIQNEILKLTSTKMESDRKVDTVELKVKQLEESNRLYEENNRKLDGEIVSLRTQISTLDSEKSELVTKHNEEIVDLKNKISELESEIIDNQEIIELMEKHNEEIRSKKKKSPKK